MADLEGKPSRFFELPRELRDVFYELLIAPSTPFASRFSAHSGLKFSVEEHIPPPLLRVSKQFSAECREFCASSRAPTVNLAIRDEGDRLATQIPHDLIEQAKAFRQLHLHLFIDAGSKHSDLKSHVKWIDHFLGELGSKDVHIKVYMRRRQGQDSQDFSRLLRSSQTGPDLSRLISFIQVATFEVYSCDNSVHSCMGIESTIGSGTTLLGLWTPESGWGRSNKTSTT